MAWNRLLRYAVLLGLILARLRMSENRSMVTMTMITASATEMVDA
jgi:hypothetical protein